MTSGGESERLFEAYSIPSPARPLFQTAFGNLNPRAPTKMDPQNPDRGPLLSISRRRRHAAAPLLPSHDEDPRAQCLR
jgi:hypothetical protein